MDDATRLAPGGGAAPSKSSSRPASHRDGRDSRPSSSTGWLSSSGAIDHGRFEPGTLLGGRYRIVERLGRGGMGEVFRADDLKLGQQVAPEFLPPDVDKDRSADTAPHRSADGASGVSPQRLPRHRHRRSRWDDVPVDGICRRRGPGHTAQARRQIPRGARARDRPSDLRRARSRARTRRHPPRSQAGQRDARRHGKVRITDFGLAGASGEAIRAGTPAYMAPEQLSGQEVTARSDLYALGLVLYEIFTGQRALEASNLAELIP